MQNISLTKGDILKLNTVLSGVKINNLEAKEAGQLVRLMVEIGKEAKQTQEVFQAMRQALLPEGLEEIEQRADVDGESLSKDELIVLKSKQYEFLNRFKPASEEFLKEELILRMNKISEDTVMSLRVHNDLTLDQLALLSACLCV